MRRRRAATIAIVAIIIAVALTFWLRDRSHHHQPARPATTSPSRGLDVAEFRAQLARRRARAHELQRRFPRSPDARTQRSGLGGLMVDPVCLLGPADLCAAVADSVDACDAGDGQACLAVGEYLEDTPPRPLVALAFFVYACKHGEQTGCDRRDQLKAPATSPPARCEDDPLQCAWQAMRTKDTERLDQACSLGVADACTPMIEASEGDPERQRTYLETACQLGSPMACADLGARLAPDCKEDCYPPDPELAREASTIACDVGFTDACDHLP